MFSREWLVQFHWTNIFFPWTVGTDFHIDTKIELHLCKRNQDIFQDCKTSNLTYPWKTNYLYLLIDYWKLGFWLCLISIDDWKSMKIHENPDFGVRNIHKSGEVSHPLPTCGWNAAPARLPHGSTISRLPGWWVRPPSPTIWRWKLVIFGGVHQQGYHWDIENGDIMEYP